MKYDGRVWNIGALTIAGLVWMGCSGSPESTNPESTEGAEPVVRYGVTVKSGPMDSVLLKDYAPESSLVLPRSHIEKARFPAVDVHAHVYAETAEEVDAWVRTMDETGIDVTVVLTGATGEAFDRLVERFLDRYPDRFQLWCGLDTSQPESADYSQRAVAELVRCVEKGASGVGELSDKGWGLGGSSEAPLARDRRLHPDDSRLDAFWNKCAELGIPVNLHIADHPSCWRPLGPNWERTPDFQGFNLYGKDVPSYEELLAMRDRLLETHSDLTVIACHLSNQGNDLEALANVLNRFPNLFLDISARDYEIGRQPRAAGAFLDRYRERLLFGTDMGRERHMYEGWWRLLESQDEFIPGRLWWRLYGLGLSDEVLKALYSENARRILKM